MFALFALSIAHALEPDLDGDGFTTSFDCDDLDAAVNPSADERCNEIDDDCDGLVDDDDDSVIGQLLYWPDLDGDGFGSGRRTLSCDPVTGHVRNSIDCDDADATSGPRTTSYQDADGDGYGSVGSVWVTCGEIPTGNVLDDGDCDDTNAAINEDAPEVCNDIDDNCDRLVDEDDPALAGNVFYDDADRDRYGDEATADATGCAQPHGYVAVGGDCAPYDVATHPNAPEICDGEDNDCDGAIDDSTVSVQWYVDADGDGYGVSSDIVRGCAQPPGYARGRGDCDDSAAEISPLSEEVCGNGLDDDCDRGRDNCSVVADDVADVVLPGSDASSFGRGVAAGDIDADGTADLLVAAPFADGNLGAVYAFPGPLTGTVSDEDALLTISGTWLGGATYFGDAFVYRDANGDGYDDLLIGAPDSSNPRAYLFLGPLTADATADDADATFWHDGHGTAFGTSVAVLDDHDGDGTPDLAFGMPGTNLRNASVAVISGDSVGDRDVRDDASYSYRSGQHDRCGQSLATLDGNGDGLDDFLVGAYVGGTAYLLEGGGDHGVHRIGEDAQATFVGDYPGAWFGWDVAAGDLDGDGYADAVVAAPYAITSAREATGAVYAFLGPLSGTFDARLADVRWEGEPDSWWSFGYSVATGSDVDGDGEIDTLIGDQYVDAANAGAVYLQLGTPSGIVTTDRLATFFGSERDALGQAVAFVPDWSGDGLDEVAAGAPDAVDDAGVTVGKVSIFFSDSLFE